MPLVPFALNPGMVLVHPGGDIQKAIDAADGEKIVTLLPGTYTLSTALLYKSTQSHLHLAALLPNTVTMNLDDSATYFSAASRSMLTSETPSAKVSQTGITTAYPAGTTQVTLTNAANADIGDLILLRRTTVTAGNEGEIRKIIGISGTTVTLDKPLYRNSFDGTSMRIDVYAPRSATVKGITFDLTNQAAGHGGISFFNLMDVLIEDCRFITGGQHGAYCMGSHTVRYVRCHAENMTIRDIAWTPERSGESLIAAGRSADVAGEGYGLAFEACDGWATDCTFTRCRHHIAAGGTSFSSAHLTYEGCRGTEDLQGAFDMHSNVDYGLISKCAASRGWAGGWVRGRHIDVEGCQFTDEAGDGVRVQEAASHVGVRRNRIRYCTNGVSIKPLSSPTDIAIEDNEIADSTSYPIYTDPGFTYTDLSIRRNGISGGTRWTIRLQGMLKRLVVDGWFRGPRTAGGGTGSDQAAVWVQADTGTSSVDNLTIGPIDVDAGSENVGTVIVLDRVQGGANLADNTFRDVRVSDVNLRTSGSSFNPTVTVANNGSGTRALVAGMERIERCIRNGALASGQTIAKGSTSVADGGTITHNLARTPTRVQLTGSVAGEIVSVTTKGATTITVAIKTGAGAAGTTQAVEWIAEVV